MSECNHDCGSCSSSCEQAGNHQNMYEALNPASKVKKVIGIVSGKGGVGKSLVTSLLAVLMHRKGYRSAILDADITGPSIPKAFGITGRAMGSDQGIIAARSGSGIQMMSLNLLLENNTDPVIWRGAMISGTVKQFWTDVIWEDVDYMFVDMPPGTGDVPLTVFQSIPLDGIIIVTSPQELVGMIVEKAVKMAEMMHIPILGLIENMSYAQCPDCGKKIEIFGKSHIGPVCETHHIPLLGQIPIQPALASACDQGAIESFQGDFLDAVAATLEEK